MNKKQKQEITWNIINSLIAGALVFFGSFTTGVLTWQGVAAAFGAAVVIACAKFRDYWIGSKGSVTKCISFI